jgi:signal transduction histidine kinase/ActR/RegA family two-component response regulator
VNAHVAEREWRIVRLRLGAQADVVVARQRARQVAEFLGMDTATQTRLATAVSEIARNALVHGGGGHADLLLAAGRRARLLVRISDEGSGLPASLRDEVDDRTSPVLLGPQRGGGLAVARRLAHSFDVQSSAGGSTITLGMPLPAGAVASAAAAASVADALARRPPDSLLEELHRQNQEMLGVLENLLNRQDELLRLNEELEETNRGVVALHEELTRELEETNRGVVALYGELDERSEQLRRTNNLKDQFISYLSHEFRTPVHSIIALAHIMLSSEEQPLTAEQLTQVRLIRRSSGTLLDLVDDLLDLAKIAAGRLTVSADVFSVNELLGALRAMMRPLVTSDAVSLIIEEPVGIQPLFSDQGKLGQILRNLVSNALKFTGEGEVRVGVAMVGHDRIAFTVSDTGVGIAPADHERIFREYEQVSGPFQRRRKGTGLGLPLSRRLAELLGGTIALESEVGAGATFRLEVPIRLQAEAAPEAPRAKQFVPAAGNAHILVVDDDEAARYVLRHFLESLGFTVSEVSNAADGLRLARQQQPGAIFVDLVMPGMSGFELVQRLAGDPQTAAIPIIVRTGKRLTEAERQSLLEHAADVLTKDEDADRDRAALRVGAALARLGIASQAPDSDRGE